MATQTLTSNLVLTLSLLFSTCINASSVKIDNERRWEKWPVVGSAELTWLFFDVYQSQLITASGTYEVGNDVTPHPLVLKIQYQRTISRKQLLEATQEQWSKMGWSKQEYQPWITKLETIFPDVEDGDILTYFTSGTVGQFFFSANGQKKMIGTVNDEKLNDAFVSIWLGNNTEYPDLRDQLIGMVQ